MARVANLDDQDQDQEKLGDQGVVDDSMGETPSAAAPKKASRFQDLSRLLYANAGRGKEIAQGAIDRANGLVGDAQGQLNTAKGQYTQAANVATPQAFTPTAAVPLTRGGGLNGGRRTTTTINIADPTAADTARAQAITTQGYQGPNTIVDTPGVDNAALSAAYDRAGQALNTLDRAPSRAQRGIGAFDNLLATQEAGGDLRKARSTFQGLRDSFNQARGDTAAADAARAATTTRAAGAQSYLDDQNAMNAERTTAQTQMTNDTEAQSKAVEDAFRDYYSTLGFGYTVLGGPNAFDNRDTWRRWWDSERAAGRNPTTPEQAARAAWAR